MAGEWLTTERKHAFLRCTVAAGGRKITLFDAHLMTPRFALSAVAGNGAESAGDVQHNALVRMREAEGLARHLAAVSGPMIVAGDLNAPVQSRACRTLLHCGLRDAYSEAGWGYGYTYGQSTALKGPFVNRSHPGKPGVDRSQLSSGQAAGIGPLARLRRPSLAQLAVRSATMTEHRGWKGQSAIITGGAAGLGLALALRLHSLGVCVTILDRSKEALDNASARVGSNCDACLVDVTSEDSVRTAVDEVIAKTGRVDILVNCAAITGRTNVRSHEVELDDFDRVMNVNVRGCLIAAQAVLPTMLAQEMVAFSMSPRSPAKKGTPACWPIPSPRRPSSQ